MSKYLIGGFRLLTKNIDLYLIGFFLGLIELLLNNYTEISGSKVLSLVIFLLFYLGAIYSVIVPAFFKDRQQGVKAPLLKIVSEILKHAKRLIIPFITFFILIILFTILIVLLFLFLGWAANLKEILMQPGIDTSRPFSLVLLLLSIIFFPFTFFSIHYSIERNGVIASAKKSIKTSLKHIKFVSVLIMLSFLTTSLIYFLPQAPLWSQIVRLILITFISMWLYSTSLLVYYQKEVAS